MITHSLRAAIASLTLLCLPLAAHSQGTFAWSNTFASRVSGWVRYGEVLASTNYDDGNGNALYAAGQIEFGNVFSGGDGVVRWNGGEWEPLAARFPVFRKARALAVCDPIGSTTRRPLLVIGGDESLTWYYPEVHGIVQWDGTTFTPLGGGIRGTVHSLCVFDDGAGPAFFAGGTFSVAGAIVANNIAKWNGSEWESLAGGVILTSGVAAVRALTVMQLPAGPVLVVGGEFDNAGGALASNVAVWNGKAWSGLGGGVSQPGGSSSVSALTVFDDGTGPVLYAGGQFSIAGMSFANNIAKWTGSEWTYVTVGTDAAVLAFGRMEEGRRASLFVGGHFGLAGGLAASRVARWDGSSWSGIGNGVASHALGKVNTLSVRDQGKSQLPFAGGDFIDPTNTAKTGALNWNGNDWINLGQPGAALNNSVNSLIEWDEDGPGPDPPAILAGGWFSGGTMSLPHRFAQFANGKWSDFHGGISGHLFYGPTVFCMTKFDEDGPGSEPECLYIGGDFTSAGGVPARGVAKWNPRTKQWSGFGSGFSDHVYGIAFYDDGNGPTLYAAGYRFLQVDGVLQSIAKWNKSASAWEKVGGGIGGTNTWIKDICVYPRGSRGRSVLVATGAFDRAGTVEALGIAQWDGKIWAPLGKGLSGGGPWGDVLHVADEDGHPILYVGGGFLSAGGSPARYLARWNGSEWRGFPNIEPSASISKIDGITIFDDGNGPSLYVAGSFRARLNATTLTDGIAKWTGSEWRSLGSGISHENTTGVLSVRTPIIPTSQSIGGSLFVGGRFASAGDIPSPFISTWTRRPASVGVSPLHRRVADGSDLIIHADVEPCGAAEFQWRRYAIPLQDSKRISGATSPEIRIESISEADAGEYDLVVTDQIGRTTGYAISVFIEPTPVTLDSSVEPLSAEPAQRNSPERASSCAIRTNALLQE